MTETMTHAEHDVPDPAPRPRPTPRGVRRVLLDSGYALSAFLLALPAFVLVVVDLGLGVGLVVLVGGLLLVCRWPSWWPAGSPASSGSGCGTMLGAAGPDAGVPLRPGRATASGAGR